MKRVQILTKIKSKQWVANFKTRKSFECRKNYENLNLNLIQTLQSWTSLSPVSPSFLMSRNMSTSPRTNLAALALDMYFRKVRTLAIRSVISLVLPSSRYFSPNCKMLASWSRRASSLGSSSHDPRLLIYLKFSGKIHHLNSRPSCLAFWCPVIKLACNANMSVFAPFASSILQKRIHNLRPSHIL